MSNQNPDVGRRPAHLFGEQDATCTYPAGRASPGLLAIVVAALCSQAGLIAAGCSSTGGTQLPEEPPASIRLSGDTSHSGEGGVVSVTVRNTGGGTLDWTARLSDSPFARIESGDSGSGSGTIEIRFDRNEGEARDVVLTVTAEDAGNSPQTRRIRQEAARAFVRLSVSGSFELSPDGGAQAVSVATGPSGREAWEVIESELPAWAAAEGRTSGSGDGSFTIRVEPNNTGQARSLRVAVKVAGDSAEGTGGSDALRFTQEAVDTTIRLTANRYDLPENGGTASLTILIEGTSGHAADAGWTFDGELPAWARFRGPTGGTRQDNRATLEVDPNETGQARSLSVTARLSGSDPMSEDNAATASFSQPPIEPPELSVSATGATTLPHTGGSVRINVSNTGGGVLNWTASVSGEGAALSGQTSAAQAGGFVVVVDENTAESPRTMRVAVQSISVEHGLSVRTITLSQEAAPGVSDDLSVKVAGEPHALPEAGGFASVHVAPAGPGADDLRWTASMNVEEMTCEYIEVKLEETPGGEDEDPTVNEVEILRTWNRGAGWASFVGPVSGEGKGSVRVEASSIGAPADCQGMLWVFSVTVSFETESKFNQTVYFTQRDPRPDPGESPAKARLRAATRYIGADGGSVDVWVSFEDDSSAYWNTYLVEEGGEPGSRPPAWTQWSGARDGLGSGSIRVRVERNPDDFDRAFEVVVLTRSADGPEETGRWRFIQRAAATAEEGLPVPPPVPGGYSNPCQRQTGGFENLGGWLFSNGHLAQDTPGRVRRVATNSSSSAGRNALVACTEARTFANAILMDAGEVNAPPEFSNLPAPTAGNSGVVMLDVRQPVLPGYGREEANAYGARPAVGAPLDTDFGWFEAGYTNRNARDEFLLVAPLGDFGYLSQKGWEAQVKRWAGGDDNPDTGIDMSSWTEIAEGYGWRLPGLAGSTDTGLEATLAPSRTLWILVGGYDGQGVNRALHPSSAVCGEMMDLCLFAPWRVGGEQGTIAAAAQVAAVADTHLLLWPDYDLMALRDHIFNCAIDMGDPGVDALWGHGILDVSCVFTPQGELKDPRTGRILSGQVLGPAQQAALSGMTGLDALGRDFAYPATQFAPRANPALVAIGGQGPARAEPAGWGYPALAPARLAQTSLAQTRLAETGNWAFEHSIASGDYYGGGATAITARWSGTPAELALPAAGFLTARFGLAWQPGGAGPLAGTRTFGAPSTFSAGFSADWLSGTPVPGLTVEFNAQAWGTLAAKARTLWQGADLFESRASAALRYRRGRFSSVLSASLASGLSGYLDLSGRRLQLSPRSARQLRLTARLGF